MRHEHLEDRLSKIGLRGWCLHARVPGGADIVASTNGVSVAAGIDDEATVERWGVSGLPMVLDLPSAGRLLGIGRARIGRVSLSGVAGWGNLAGADGRRAGGVGPGCAA